MARGLISGLLVGGIVSAGAIGAMSVLSPLPQSPRIEAAPGAVSAPPAGSGATEKPPRGQDSDLAEIPPTAPAEQAGTDDLDAVGSEATDPAARPAVEAETAGLGTPSAAGTSPTVPSGTGGAGQPSASDPDLPRPEPSDAPISAVPEQPSAPDVTETGSGFGGEAPAEGQPPEVSRETDPEVDTAAGTEDMDAAGTDGTPDTASAEPSEQPAPQGTAPAQPGAATGSKDAGTVTAEAPVTAPSDSGETPSQPGEAPNQPQIQEPAQPPAPRIAALPQSGSEAGDEDRGPTVGTRVRPLTERDETVSRDAASDGPPAIEAYAQPFENPENKPLMSIVLIDDADAFGAEALQDFPYPLTFALDPRDSASIEKMQRYRAAGFEVALLTNLPPAATPQDAEVAMEAALAALPDTVALFEGVGSGFQGNRSLSDQITLIAQADGRGMVTQSNGLNTVQKLAARKGVPSTVVFRDFDGAGQSPDTIRRFLDQAAFRADQEGAVVMLGRVRPDTISALLLWGLQDRASRVALSPLSAALLRKME